MTDTIQEPGSRMTYGAVAGLPEMLLKAHGEICGVLRRLRQGRDALDQATEGKLKKTTEKLQEVSSATEMAANGILDGLDRATALVDELDALAPGDQSRAAEVRTNLRDELFQAIGCLQFQDITSQQLNYASSILVDMEARLAELAVALDPTSANFAENAIMPGISRAFDPGASLAGAEGRQALADSIFESPS